MEKKDLKKVNEAGGGNSSLLGARNDTAPDNRTDGAEAGLYNAIAPTDNKERAIEAGNGTIGGTAAAFNDAARFTDWVSGHGAYGQSGRDFSYGLMQMALVNPCAAGAVLAALTAASVVHAMWTSTFIRYKKTRNQLNKMRKELLSSDGYKAEGEGGLFSFFKKKKNEDSGQGPIPFKEQVMKEVEVVNKILFDGRSAACDETGGVGGGAKPKHLKVADYENKSKLNPVASALFTSTQYLYTPKPYLDKLTEVYKTMTEKIGGGKVETIGALKEINDKKLSQTPYTPLIVRARNEIKDDILCLGNDLVENFKQQNAYAFKRGDGEAVRRYNDLKKIWKGIMREVEEGYKKSIDEIMRSKEYAKMTSGIDAVATLQDSVASLSSARADCEVDDLWAGNISPDGKGKGLQFFTVADNTELQLGGDVVTLEFVNSDLAGTGKTARIKVRYSDLYESGYKLYRSSDDRSKAGNNTHNTSQFSGDGQFYVIQTRTGEVFEADRGPVSVAGSGNMYVQAWKQTISSDASVTTVHSPMGTVVPTSGSIICYRILNYDYVGLLPTVYWDTEERFNSSIILSGLLPKSLKKHEGENIKFSKNLVLNEEDEHSDKTDGVHTTEDDEDMGSDPDIVHMSEIHKVINGFAPLLKKNFLLKSGFYYIQEGDKSGDLIFAKTIKGGKIYCSFASHTSESKNQDDCYEPFTVNFSTWNKFSPIHILYKPITDLYVKQEDEYDDGENDINDDIKVIFKDHSDENYPISYGDFYKSYRSYLNFSDTYKFVEFQKMAADFNFKSYGLIFDDGGNIIGICKSDKLILSNNLSMRECFIEYLKFLGDKNILFDSKDDYIKTLGGYGDTYISKSGSALQDNTEEVEAEVVEDEYIGYSKESRLYEDVNNSSDPITETYDSMRNVWKSYSKGAFGSKDCDIMNEIPEGIKISCSVFKKYLDEKMHDTGKSEMENILSHIQVGGYAFVNDDFENIINVPDIENTEDLQDDLNPENIYYNDNIGTKTVEVVNIDGVDDQKKITIRYAIEGKVHQKILSVITIKEKVKHKPTQLTKFSEDNDLIDDMVANKLGIRIGWTYVVKSDVLAKLIGGEAAHEALRYKLYNQLYESYLTEAEDIANKIIFVTCKNIDTTKKASIIFTRHDGQDQDVEVKIMDLIREDAKTKNKIFRRYVVPFIKEGQEYTFKSKTNISFKDMFGQDGDENTVLKVESKDNSNSIVKFAWSGNGVLELPFYKIRKEDFIPTEKKEEEKKDEFPTIGHIYLISKEDYVNNITNKNEEVNKQADGSKVRIVIDAITDDKKIVTLHINKDVQNKIEVPMEKLTNIKDYEDVTGKEDTMEQNAINFFGKEGLCEENGLSEKIAHIKTLSSNLDQVKALFDQDANYKTQVNMYLFGKDIQDTNKAVELLKGVCDNILNSSSDLQTGGEYVVCYLAHGNQYPEQKKCKVGNFEKDGKEYYILEIEGKKYFVDKEKANMIIFARMANPLLESELIKLGVNGATFINKVKYSMSELYNEPLYEAIVVDTNKPDQISKLVNFLDTLFSSIDPNRKQAPENKQVNNQQQDQQQDQQQTQTQQQAQQQQAQQPALPSGGQQQAPAQQQAKESVNEGTLGKLVGGAALAASLFGAPSCSTDNTFHNELPQNKEEIAKPTVETVKTVKVGDSDGNSAKAFKAFYDKCDWSICQNELDGYIYSVHNANGCNTTYIDVACPRLKNGIYHYVVLWPSKAVMEVGAFVSAKELQSNVYELHLCCIINCLDENGNIVIDETPQQEENCKGSLTTKFYDSFNDWEVGMVRVYDKWIDAEYLEGRKMYDMSTAKYYFQVMVCKALTGKTYYVKNINVTKDVYEAYQKGDIIPASLITEGKVVSSVGEDISESEKSRRNMISKIKSIFESAYSSDIYAESIVKMHFDPKTMEVCGENAPRQIYFELKTSDFPEATCSYDYGSYEREPWQENDFGKWGGDYEIEDSYSKPELDWREEDKLIVEFIESHKDLIESEVLENVRYIDTKD